MVGREILEVLYSPVNAFRKIIEKPDFKGVLIVLLLVISATVALQFVYNERQLYENRAPQDDLWTETLTNPHIWSSIESASLDTQDYQMGNGSISSSVMDSTSIWLKILDIDAINCYEETGYNELFFWINWNNDAGAPPTSGTLKLFSGSEDSYFETDITNLLPSSGEWGNTTLNVGPNQGWASNNSPDWQNITGIEFTLVWSDSANLALNIDGLFFRNYITSIEAAGLETAILYILFSVTFSVGINWVLWAGILFIVSKLFGEELGKWNVVFVIIGHAFLATAVYTLVSTLIFTSLPILTMPVESDLQVAAFSETWLPNLAYQAGTLILWAGEIWIAALSAIVIRLLKDITWGKAATISAVAFGVRFILRIFFGL
ncbi:MAG: hypothetical protein CW691_06375 [Candidatus Bathyarchaeum sp.]|nr:MAG: hypothetical protein CW691_06375 [Candidatus Bathyarchaeum sp.]